MKTLGNFCDLLCEKLHGETISSDSSLGKSIITEVKHVIVTVRIEEKNYNSRYFEHTQIFVGILSTPKCVDTAYFKSKGLKIIAFQNCN